MIRRFHKLIFGIQLIHGACSASLSIKSSPIEADVYIAGEKVGKTPINLSYDAFKKVTSNPLFLILKKEGYRDMIVVIPKGYDHLTANINLRNNKSLDTTTDSSGNKTPDFLIKKRDQINNDLSTLLDLQLAVFQSKKIDIETLKNIQKRYPNLSSPYFLESLAMRIQGDLSLAKKAAEEALTRDPNESEYGLLIDLIKKNETKS